MHLRHIVKVFCNPGLAARFFLFVCRMLYFILFCCFFLAYQSFVLLGSCCKVWAFCGSWRTAGCSEGFEMRQCYISVMHLGWGLIARADLNLGVFPLKQIPFLSAHPLCQHHCYFSAGRNLLLSKNWKNAVYKQLLFNNFLPTRTLSHLSLACRKQCGCRLSNEVAR